MRDNFVDIVKGLAMIMVVRIHTEGFSGTIVPYPIIAVPLFFFLSGFYDRAEKPWKFWLVKTARSLLLTSLIWCFLYIFYLSFLTSIKEQSLVITGYKLTWDTPFIGESVTWFLVALFIAKCLTGCVVRLKVGRWLQMTIVFTSSWFVSLINLPFLLDEGISAWAFYFAGKQIYPYIKSCFSNAYVLLFGGVSLILMTQGWFPNVLINYNSSLGFGLYPLFFFMVCMSLLPMLEIGMLIERKAAVLSLLLGKYGRSTLGILVVHPLISHTCAVVLNRVFVPKSTIWTITSLITFVFICLFSYVLTNFINRYIPILFGKTS